MYVKNWMPKKVVTIDIGNSLSIAINTLKRIRIRRMPIMDRDKLVGIIAEQDIFGALIVITGARKTAQRLTVTIPDAPGCVKDLCYLMRNYSFKCVSILTSQMEVEKGFRQVLLRFQADEGDIENILAEVKNKYSNAELTVD